MSNSKLNVFSLSESDKLKNQLKNPEDSFQEIVSLLERKVEERSNQLRVLDEKYHSLIDGLTHVGIGIDVVNKDYEVLFQNQVLKDKFGDCRGKNCFRSYMRVEKPCEFCPLEKALKNNSIERTELEAADGRSYELISAPYPNQDGTIDKVAEVVIDITKRKKVELKLKESEEKYRGLINNITDIIFELDIKGKCTYVSNQLLKISGFHPEEMIGQNVFQYLHPEDLLNVTEKVKEAFQNGLRISIDFRIRHKDGYYVPVSSNFNVIRINGEQRFIGVLRDNTEKRKIEQELLKEKEFTETALNTQRDTFFVFEPSTGKAIRWNRAFRDVSGYSNEEISKLKAPDSYYSEDDLKRAALTTEKINAEGEALIKMNMITKDGNEIPFEYLGSSINDEEGNLKFIVSIGRNITDREQTDAVLQESEHFLKKAQIIAHIGHWKLNPLTLEVSGSDELFNIFELSPDDATLDAFTEVVHPDDREYNLYHIRRGMAHGESWDIEHRLINKKGTEKWVRALGEAVKNENDEIIMLLGTIQDITDQKESEEKLKKSEEKYSNLFQYSSDAIILHDLEGNIVDINQNARKWLGYTKSEFLNMNISQLHPSKDLELSKNKLKDINKNKFINFEISFKRKNGEIFPADLSAKIIEIDDKIIIQGEIRDINDTKKAEQKLKESEEKYKTLVEQSLQGIIIIQDMRIVFANSAMAEILGYSVEELLCFSTEESVKMIHQEDRTFVLNRHKDRMERKTVPNHYEYRIIRKDNVVRTIELYATVIEYEGKIASQQVFIDITERKETERKLKESEENFRTIAEDSHLAITILQDDLVVYTNQKMADMFGYEREEMLTWTPKEYAKTVAEDSLVFIMEQARKKQIGDPDVTLQYPIHCVKSSGEKFWVDNISTTIIYNGRPADLVTIIDITDVRKAQQKLKDSEENFRNIAEQSFMGIEIIQDDKIKYVNEAASKILEYSTQEMKVWEYEGLFKFVYPEDLPIIYEQQKKRLESKEHQIQYSVRTITKSGKIKWLEISSKMVLYQGKEATFVIFYDVSERKEAEQELIRLNHMKSELLRRTSHELKTPLVSIKGFAELLLQVHRDKLDALVISTINEIKQGCLRLETLIGDILKTAELESGKTQLHKSEEDLSFLVRVCVNEIRGFSKLRNNNINLALQESLITQFEKEQIHQVISNLLSNAVKYTPPGGLIEIKSEIRDDFMIISISDNGIGFTEDEKGRIFKQFGKIERYGQGMDIISEGSGLGLFISKRIMELHLGDLWMESEGRNQGSTFYFKLPIIHD